MRSAGLSPAETLVRLLAIGGAVVGMLLLLILVSSLLLEGEEPARHPPVAPLSPPEPIPAEADAFRLGPGSLAVAFDAPRRPGTHPRNMATYQRLRAYPGAPPRIPHGLTDAEFRGGLCNHCHAGGGYSPRFGAYAPVTPHPEWTECLQCHTADARTVGLSLPDPFAASDELCSQCHVDPDAPPPSFVAVDWRPRDWPERHLRAMDGAPPAIPHDLELRGNCLACHAGPAAVRELRTTHPERADCRQCHVLASDRGAAAGTETPVFVRTWGTGDAP